MVKVLVVNITSLGGGAETVLRNLVEMLREDNGGLCVDTLSKDTFSQGRRAGKLMGYLLFLREVRARSANYDVVVSGVEGIPFLLCLAALAGRARPALAMWLHCVPSGYLPFQTLKNRLAIRAGLAAARHVICAAPAEAQRLAARGRSALFLPNLRRAGHAVAAPPPRLQPHLCFVGSLAPLKQPLKALEVLELLRRRDGAYTLDMFGSGRLAQPLAAKIRQSGLEQCVTVHGFVREPWATIAPGSILLLPSLTEAMPMVVLEAFDHGCVVVANTFDGHGFFDRHEGLFVAVDFTDPQRAADVIEGCMRWSAEELRARAERSQAFIRTEFDNRRSLDTMRTYFEQIVRAA
jgi:glycosyltransferase involved in cell wall biosynthesis